MRALFNLAIAGAALATASSADATITFLEADAGAGACGGSISCAVSQTSIPANPNNGSVAMANADSTLPDGSYADGHAKIVFGHMHLYADAFRAGASGGDAQSSAKGRVHEDFAAASLTPGLQKVTFMITGSHSDVEHVFGNYAYGYFSWDIYDSVTNQDVDGGYWESTDAVQQATLLRTFDLPAGHGYYMNEYFEAATYSSFGVVDVAGYQDTIDTYIATPGGQDVIGESGHDYAAPAVAGAPEPAAWAMMAAGFGVLGGLARRRRAASPVGAIGAAAQTA